MSRTRQKARSRMQAPRAAGPPHVSAYLRIKERCDLKDEGGDLLGTDRCALQLIVFPCRVNIRVFQGKVPVGREDTSDYLRRPQLFDASRHTKNFLHSYE